MTGIKRSVTLDAEGDIDERPLVTWRGVEHASEGIDHAGNAGIGRAQQPTMVFDRPHAGLFQMLPRGGGVAEPAVVRNVYEHLRAVRREIAYLAGEHRLVTDEGADRQAPRPEYVVVAARDEVADFAGQLIGKSQKLLEGYVLAEG